MPATTDYWVNDQRGDPLFVVTAEANAGLVKMLPEVLTEVRRLVGDRRVTIVFDRGGWSPKLFLKLIDDGFDILTYRKGARRINETHGSFSRTRQRSMGARSTTVCRPGRPLPQGQAPPAAGHPPHRRRPPDPDRHRRVATLPPSRSPTACSSAGARRTSSSTCARSSPSTPSSTTASSPTTRPATCPTPPRHDARRGAPQAARAEVAKLEQAYGAAAVANPEKPPPDHARLQDRPRQARQAAPRRARPRHRTRRAPPRHPRTGPGPRCQRPAPSSSSPPSASTSPTSSRWSPTRPRATCCRLLGPHYGRTEDEGRTLLHELFRPSPTSTSLTASSASHSRPQLAASHACGPGPMRDPHPHGDGVPRIAAQDALRHPAAAADRPCLPWAAASTARAARRSAGILKADISCGGEVRRSEL